MGSRLGPGLSDAKGSQEGYQSYRDQLFDEIWGSEGGRGGRTLYRMASGLGWVQKIPDQGEHLTRLSVAPHQVERHSLQKHLSTNVDQRVFPQQGSCFFSTYFFGCYLDVTQISLGGILTKHRFLLELPTRDKISSRVILQPGISVSPGQRASPGPGAMRVRRTSVHDPAIP
ncbi:hypothetical protein RRG08_046056 [Elysia crispata]|uniref:Uncharacterized protein n=1 Tax=Elysia crispata TaxID=231223 RepID=A0AAE1AAU6_9GAST|nr:hypothetical protein RRG08_046056 [Elysia crispata]